MVCNYKAMNRPRLYFNQKIKSLLFYSVKKNSTVINQNLNVNHHSTQQPNDTNPSTKESQRGKVPSTYFYH